ncbi:MAG: Rieske (2Fe-2S) protein [Anaerolineales bacterium]|nr:Rieske (2Fe-2S) protein [Anaerolineales bacterium]
MTTTSDTPTPQSISRRGFLKWSLGGLAALAALETVGVGFRYLQSRADETEFAGVVRAGVVEEFPPGSVTEFVSSGFYLIRAHDGGFLALYRRCPHLGCIVNWEQSAGEFYCPCHASHFDFVGNFENPPVSRALDCFAVEIDGDEVIVDTSRITRRARFDPGELVYAPA